jgi:hypothetical protein
MQNGEGVDKQELKKALDIHLECAEAAARRRYHIRGNSETVQKAMSNLYAAEAHLVHFAPVRTCWGKCPSLLNHIQRRT